MVYELICKENRHTDIENNYTDIPRGKGREGWIERLGIDIHYQPYVKRDNYWEPDVEHREPTQCSVVTCMGRSPKGRGCMFTYSWATPW